jgi:hypothetical protein
MPQRHMSSSRRSTFPNIAFLHSRRTAAGRLALVGALGVVVAGPSSHASAAVLYATDANLDRLSVYRITANGGLQKTPFQQVFTAENPRRMALTSRALYVATRTRIEAFEIDEMTGGLSRFKDDTGRVINPANVPNANFQYLTVDPSERYLYAASTAQDRILGYPIAADGSIDEVGSCTQGTEGTRYQGLAATDSVLYAVAHIPGRVVLFPLREDGAIQALATDPTNDEDGGAGGDTLEVFTACNDPRLSFPPESTKNFSNPKVLLLNAPFSQLYITDIFEDRIYSCPIAGDGTLPDCPKQKKSPDVSRTLSGGQYEQLALSGKAVLYASVFQTGNLRAFVLAGDGSVPKRHARDHPADLFTAPGGVAIWCDAVLYAGQGDADRIDAFRIDAKGFVGGKKKLKPFASTAREGGSFPNALAVLLLAGESCD